jgi:3'-5' exoribonuclease
MTASRTRSASTPLDPRAFCGDQFPWRLIGELNDGEDVTAVYLVLESRKLETKQSKPYLKLVLGDRTGSIDGMVWDDADRFEPHCPVEAVIGVRGRVGSFNDRLQLRVHSLELLSASADDYRHLLPASHRDQGEMERELETLIASVRDAGLRGLLQRCLGADTETGRIFRVHPAAKRNHHAYLSGLLEHSLSVAGACDRLAAHYAATGVPLDRDLLVTAALLHDIGKLRELKGFPGVVYTTEGQLLGHIVIGMQMVQREAEALGTIAEQRLLHLQHLIASHQGRPEWDSPKSPQLLEALVLHYADDLDAKLNQANGLLAGVEVGEWSAYDRSFGRAFLRGPTPPREALSELSAGEGAARPSRPSRPPRPPAESGDEDGDDHPVMDLFR